jgi:hypothetical protein
VAAALRSPRAARLSALALALAGCGGAGEAGPDGAPDGSAGSAELRVGSTTEDGSGFVPADGGDDVALVAGAQGGFHVWTGARLRGVVGPVLLVRTARRVTDGALVLAATPRHFEVPEAGADDWWQIDAALPSFMCPTPIGIAVRDERLEIAAELRTEGDDRLLAADSIEVTPRCPAGEQAAFCAEICSG